jgi:hypothetical protein
MYIYIYLSFLPCGQPDGVHVWSKFVPDMWTQYIVLTGFILHLCFSELKCPLNFLSLKYEYCIYLNVSQSSFSFFSVQESVFRGQVNFVCDYRVTPHISGDKLWGGKNLVLYLSEFKICNLQSSHSYCFSFWNVESMFFLSYMWCICLFFVCLPV